MGQCAAAAYSLGVAFGTTSYQVSVRQFGLAAALRDWQYRADDLNQCGFFDGRLSNLSNVNVSSNEGIINDRQAVAENIRSHKGSQGTDVANIFTLGLLLGMAEGQASGPAWSDAVDIAHQGLGQAMALIHDHIHVIENYKTMDRLRSLNAQTVNIDTGTPKDVHTGLQQLNTDFFNDINAESGLP